MNLRDLSKQIQAETGLTYKDANAFLVITIKLIIKNILKGHKVKLPGFGTFYVDVVQARSFHNPNTRKIETKPKRFVLQQSISRALRKSIDAKRTY